MPQIDQVAETFSSQFFWLLVFFGITYFLVGRSMVPKVMGTVQLRDKQIADDLAAAKAARDAADAQEEEWREKANANRAEAQAVIAEAKGKAQANTEAKMAEAQARLDTELAAAEKEIDAARSAAMDEIEQVASDATQSIVSRLAGQDIDEKLARDTVKKVLSHA